MIYYIILIVVLGAAIAISPKMQNKKQGVLLAVIALLGLVCGLRDMLGGYDNYIYGEIFDDTARELREGIPWYDTTAMNWEHSEKGYGLYSVLIARLTTNRYIFFFITSIVIFGGLYYHLRKLTDYPFVALLFFLGLFYFFTWAYIRQALAVIIVSMAIPYAVQRKPIHFAAWVFAGVMFHSSAIMFLPVYVVAGIKFSRTQLILFSLAALILGLTPLGSFIVQNLGGQVDEEKTLDTLNSQGEARIDYILEAFFFFSIIISQYGKLKMDKTKTCLLNITFLFVLTLLMFSRFLNGGRLTWCYLIGVSCLMPEIVMQARKAQLVKVVSYAMMTILYLRIFWGWGMMLSPYKTFLTDGVRSGDIIYENYEYDQNYANDKFYKW